MSCAGWAECDSTSSLELLSVFQYHEPWIPLDVQVGLVFGALFEMNLVFSFGMCPELQFSICISVLLYFIVMSCLLYCLTSTWKYPGSFGFGSELWSEIPSVSWWHQFCSFFSLESKETRRWWWFRFRDCPWGELEVKSKPYKVRMKELGLYKVTLRRKDSGVDKTMLIKYKELCLTQNKVITHLLLFQK